MRNVKSIKVLNERNVYRCTDGRERQRRRPFDLTAVAFASSSRSSKCIKSVTIRKKMRHILFGRTAERNRTTRRSFVEKPVESMKINTNTHVCAITIRVILSIDCTE